ncbi:hypothetical protein [Shewanella sp. TB7-MNA-CIBAN-0143]|uniref:hypothetical protein n=1 Tax=Shewanella sp. TB7-MNA-CIBAN-0143 TaxID=3140465 RepID=UPI003324478C
MARKQKNDDIGEITCPFTGDVAPVRRDCNGKLYYVGKAGMIKPNMPTGQDWMLENAVIWPMGKRPQAANDNNEPVTELPPTVMAALALTGTKSGGVPVNESSSKKPVNDAQSQNPQQVAEKPPKISFGKWLIG